MQSQVDSIMITRAVTTPTPWMPGEAGGSGTSSPQQVLFWLLKSASSCSSHLTLNLRMLEHSFLTKQCRGSKALKRGREVKPLLVMLVRDSAAAVLIPPNYQSTWEGHRRQPENLSSCYPLGDPASSSESWLSPGLPLVKTVILKVDQQWENLNLFFSITLLN